jgi:hypothetical protein
MLETIVLTETSSAVIPSGVEESLIIVRIDSIDSQWLPPQRFRTRFRFQRNLERYKIPETLVLNQASEKEHLDSGYKHDVQVLRRLLPAVDATSANHRVADYREVTARYFSI